MASDSDNSLLENPESESLLSTSTSSAGTSMERSTNRKRNRQTAAVWQYFEKSDNGNSSTCQIKISDGRMCRFSLKGNNPTNLENHLRYKHPNIFNELRETKKRIKVEKAKSIIEPQQHQLTLEESMSRKETISKKYANNHPKQLEADCNLTLLLAGTSMPYQIVEQEEFKAYISCLDSRISLPNRRKASQMIATVKKDIQDCVSKLINGNTLAICADIWSRRGSTASYLGIWCQFFDHVSKRPQRALLGMPKIEAPHTGARIAADIEECLGRYNLSLDSSKIFKIVTDNGSNIVKAFKDVMHFSNVYYAEHESRAEDEQEFLESNLDVEDESDDDNFDDEEGSVQRAFFSCKKRLSCVDHSLCLVLKNVVDKDQSLNQVKKVAFELINSINRSTTAVPFMLKETNKKLLMPPSHRWVCSFYALDRLLEQRDVINRLIDIEQLIQTDNLSATQSRQVAALRDLLKPFEANIRELEGEQYGTISKVVPTLYALLIQMQELSTTFRGRLEMANAANKLRTEISMRFSNIIDSGCADFEPIYAIATLLDPMLTRTLDLPNALSLKTASIKEMKCLLSNLGSTNQRAEVQQPSTTTIAAASASTSNPYQCLFDRLHQNNALEAFSNQNNICVEVDDYIRERDRLAGTRKDALAFWKEKISTYPALANLALNIMIVPATSAPIERVFSQAGLCCDAKRNRLCDENLESEVMFRVNKNLLKSE